MRLFVLFCTVLSILLPDPAGAGEGWRTAHVLVALCDNLHQRIAPVPASLGRGDDTAGNLYWGAAYGIKTFFRKQPGWTMRVADRPGPEVLERIVLRNERLKVQVVADAYDGRHIRKCTVDFLALAAGKGGQADLVVYVGHNGLMDFTLRSVPKGGPNGERPVSIFACQSKAYFGPALRSAGAYPLIWTRGNMAPEAYVVHALITAWGQNREPAAVREAVAVAYDKYQKCGLKGARGLFASGW